MTAASILVKMDLLIPIEFCSLLSSSSTEPVHTNVCMHGSFNVMSFSDT